MYTNELRAIFSEPGFLVSKVKYEEFMWELNVFHNIFRELGCILSKCLQSKNKKWDAKFVGP